MWSGMGLREVLVTMITGIRRVLFAEQYASNPCDHGYQEVLVDVTASTPYSMYLLFERFSEVFQAFGRQRNVHP